MLMRRKGFIWAAPVIAAALVLTACSSSSKGGGGSSSSASGGSSSSAAAGGSGSASGGGEPIKVGVINDTTGAAASGFQTTEVGIKAYFNAVNAAGGVNGQKIEYVMADSTSTPAGALNAAHKLVQTDHVFAILSTTSFFFGAQAYALKEGIPVIGQGFDGTEWADPKNTNMFATGGVNDFNKVYANSGQLMKALGVTSCGSVAYADSPSSEKSGENTQKSCVAAGLKDGYLKGIPFGSTDVGPIALAMKSAGVDGVYLPVDPNTGFALAGALRQHGVQTKAVLLATGYGGDLLGSPAAVTAAQGFQFTVTMQPVEMNTPATQKWQKNLAAVGYTGIPTSAIQFGYQAAAGFVRGLQASGANPTQASYIAALRKVNDFDVDGLISPNKVSFSNYAPSQSCLWAVTLEGTKFVPVPNIPFCSGTI
jgi:branched-chain amino acid transport system substrate-binding protein